MSERKSLAERIDQGSFRPDRHAELLATSPPLPERAPADVDGYPRLHDAWTSMRTFQAAAAASKSSDARTHAAHRFAAASADYRQQVRFALMPAPQDVVPGLAPLRASSRIATDNRGLRVVTRARWRNDGPTGSWSAGCPSKPTFPRRYVAEVAADVLLRAGIGR